MANGQLEHLRDSWSSDPEDCEAGRAYGAALYDAGAFEEARRVLRMVADHAGTAQDLVLTGRALESLSAWADAESAYQRALDLDPLHADAHGFRAAILLRRDGVEAAEPSLRQWASFSSAPAQAHFQIARLFQGRAPDLAANHLQIALDLDPRHADATELLGIVLAAAGDLHGSVAAWRAARTLRPDSPNTAAGLGVALSRAGSHEEAVRLLEEGVLGSVERLAMGRSLRELGDLARAVEVLEAAIKEEDGFAEAMVELGLVYLKDDEFERAIESLERAVEVAPTLASAHHHLGRALARAARRAPALAALMKAASLAPTDPVVQSDLKALQDELRGAPKPQDSSEMSGLLDVVTLPNLLEFFTNNAASGELIISAAEGREARVFLVQGRISAAWGTGVGRLGDLLVEAGDVSRDSVEAALSDPSAQMTAARVLADKGVASEEMLSRRLDDQIIAVLMQAATWKGGAFQFRRGARFTDKAHAEHSLDTRFALMEVMRVLDEVNAGRR